jgi:AcrR family transcriptional regulator
MRRDELLEAGMRLFGERGYEATSVADIQVACGLTAGSGALYKHFASKRELLAEGIHRYVDAMKKSAAELIPSLPADPRAALTIIAEAVSSAMARDRAIIRVGLRDLEQFPELLEVLWDGLLVALYRELTAWLDAQQELGRIQADDTAATAAVLVASLTYYRVLESLIGHSPGDIELDAYLTAWVDSAVATLNSGRSR